MIVGGLVVALTGVAPVLAAQAPAPAPPPAAVAPSETDGPKLPADYVIGVADALDVRFWGHDNMTSTVVVRPDGRISLPLLNDVEVAGLTPDQLRDRLTTAGAKFFTDAPAFVTVREINSRQVFVTGMVANPGSFPLGGGMRVLQLIALAGGLNEYANRSKISVIRDEGSKQVRLPFNYDQIRNGRNLEQNIELRPGDTVLVP
ncbi:MAG: hypothetical protein ABS36_17335 [Acidobacteria bacterium SCN 69-37]|nr:MAG: hypothetical protein ABS36_17335 [Acidobacteria bacterium SCN 69-37]